MNKSLKLGRVIRSYVSVLERIELSWLIFKVYKDPT